MLANFFHFVTMGIYVIIIVVIVLIMFIFIIDWLRTSKMIISFTPPVSNRCLSFSFGMSQINVHFLKVEALIFHFPMLPFPF
jgi:hypothetical protein